MRKKHASPKSFRRTATKIKKINIMPTIHRGGYLLMKFRKAYEETPDIGQTFDRNAYVIKNGNKINCYDEIQANNIDTDIYKTLEKYGSIERANKYQAAEMIYADFDREYTLADIDEFKKKAENLFAQLHPDIRQEFGQDLERFEKEGLEWAKKHFAPKNEKPKNEPKGEETK